MTLRTRIGVIAALAVAVAVAVASAGLYVATRRTLQGAVDRALVDIVSDLDRRGPPDRSGGRGPAPGPRPGPRFGGAGGYIQVVSASGAVQGQADGEVLPVTDRARACAAGRQPAFFETLLVDGEPVRVLTVPRQPGVALQVARPLGEVADVLDALRRQLLVVAMAGVALAAALGTLVARRAARPVLALTALAEEVAATHDLRRRIDVTTDDELGRLARTLNAMLANLEQARSAQQQLIADASHELRTPLTSLRTNIETLTRADELSASQRQSLIADVVEQLDEFSGLVTALVELARGDAPPRAARQVRLDQLVSDVVDRTRRRAVDGPAITVHASPSTVMAESDRVERAVANLVDNAVKYGAGSAIDVTVADGNVTVRDHGPGIDEDDLPHVFDRFYRAPAARSAPGAGLGLSIVAQVASAHGGSVSAENARDGGAVFTFCLPAHAGTDAGRGDPVITPVA
jgi:two-component system, OmpR family, sensor histidine kinase MprB